MKERKLQDRKRLYFRQHYFLLILIVVLIIICCIQFIKIGILKKNINVINESETYPTATPYHVITPFPAPTETPLPIIMATPTPIPSLDDDPENIYDGPVLNAFIGTVEGPSGKETYYNLPMEGVVSIMRDLGYTVEDYPYWVREDGCKMFGPYIMCAADLETRPKGTILKSSLGDCMVCDTGEFVNWNSTQIDIAVTW